MVKSAKSQKIRSSITPGAILIILAGKHKGKRVVCLEVNNNKGTVLVTGPYKCNGVPLKFIHHSYVIGTKTKIDIPSGGGFIPSDLYAKVEDSRIKGGKLNDLQSQIDTKILDLVQKEPLLKGYLKTIFTLKKGQAPHQMIF